MFLYFRKLSWEDVCIDVCRCVKIQCSRGRYHDPCNWSKNSGGQQRRYHDPILTWRLAVRRVLTFQYKMKISWPKTSSRLVVKRVLTRWRYHDRGLQDSQWAVTFAHQLSYECKEVTAERHYDRQRPSSAKQHNGRNCHYPILISTFSVLIRVL